MLVKLDNNQVSLYWPALEEAIEKTIPNHPGVPIVERKNQVLFQLLEGTMEAWLGVSDGSEGRELEGAMFTRKEQDRILLTKNLLIYALYFHRQIKREQMDDYFNTLVEYARRENCQVVSCFTNNPQFVQFMKKKNANIQYRYITLTL